jgi:hypothetical protein
MVMALSQLKQVGFSRRKLRLEADPRAVQHDIIMQRAPQQWKRAAINCHMPVHGKKATRFAGEWQTFWLMKQNLLTLVVAARFGAKCCHVGPEFWISRHGN